MYDKYNVLRCSVLVKISGASFFRCPALALVKWGGSPKALDTGVGSTRGRRRVGKRWEGGDWLERLLLLLQDIW